MAITLTELQEKLKKIDEVSLMEVLEITSEDMVQRFVDRIEEQFDELVTEFDDCDEDCVDFYIPWVDEEEELEEDYDDE